MIIKPVLPDNQTEFFVTQFLASTKITIERDHQISSKLNWKVDDKKRCKKQLMEASLEEEENPLGRVKDASWVETLRQW